MRHELGDGLVLGIAFVGEKRWNRLLQGEFPLSLGGDTEGNAMTAFTKLAFACVLAGGLAAPALAAPGDAGSGPTIGATPTNDAGSGPTQGAASSTGKTTSPTGAMNGHRAGAINGQQAGAMNDQHAGAMHVVQKMRQNLSNSGFTDIQIMPSSFLARGKDLSGNPVMMVVNPDSVTAITEDNSSARSANNSSHMGGTASNEAGATPGPKSTGGSQPVTPGATQTKP